MRIPLSRLLFADNIPAGMDLLTIAAIAAILRKSNEPIEPILIRAVPGTDLYRVTDGRHRTVGAFIAGRVDIEARVE